MKPESQALLDKASESRQAAELLKREGYLDFPATLPSSLRLAKSSPGRRSWNPSCTAT